MVTVNCVIVNKFTMSYLQENLVLLSCYKRSSNSALFLLHLPVLLCLVPFISLGRSLSACLDQQSLEVWLFPLL